MDFHSLKTWAENLENGETPWETSSCNVIKCLTTPTSKDRPLVSTLDTLTLIPPSPPSSEDSGHVTSPSSLSSVSSPAGDCSPKVFMFYSDDNNEKSSESYNNYFFHGDHFPIEEKDGSLFPTSTGLLNETKTSLGLDETMQPFKSRKCMWIDCKVTCDSMESLVNHIERVHVEGRKEDFSCFWHGCPRRNRPFNARYKLLIHMRVHSGHKPNKCAFPGCSKSFSRLENLKIHIRSHTNERPYKCPYCCKSFSNSSDRAKHQRTHFDKKPYACSYPGCDKRYTDPSSLRKHAKIHYVSDPAIQRPPVATKLSLPVSPINSSEMLSKVSFTPILNWSSGECVKSRIPSLEPQSFHPNRISRLFGPEESTKSQAYILNEETPEVSSSTPELLLDSSLPPALSPSSSDIISSDLNLDDNFDWITSLDLGDLEQFLQI